MGITKIFMWKWLNTALEAVASFSFNLSSGKKSVDALQQGVYGLFLCQNREIGHALKIPDNRGEILQTPQFT